MGGTYDKSGVDPERLDAKIAELEGIKLTRYSSIRSPLFSFSEGPCRESLKFIHQATCTRHSQIMDDMFDTTINYLKRVGEKLEKL